MRSSKINRVNIEGLRERTVTAIEFPQKTGLRLPNYVFFFYYSNRILSLPQIVVVLETGDTASPTGLMSG